MQIQLQPRRQQIISDLFNGKNFNDCLNKMEPDYLREDLKQEVILIICELDEKKLISLHTEKRLEFFTVKVILNQIKSSTSPFAKKYRRFLSEYSEGLADAEKEVRNTGNEISAIERKFLGKKHLDHYSCSDIDFEERELREMVEDMAVEEVDQLYWYNKGLVDLYMKHGNFRAIQKETGIPWKTAYRTIKQSFQSIKEKVTA